MIRLFGKDLNIETW